MLTCIVYILIWVDGVLTDTQMEHTFTTAHPVFLAIQSTFSLCFLNRSLRIKVNSLYVIYLCVGGCAITSSGTDFSKWRIPLVMAQLLSCSSLSLAAYEGCWHTGRPPISMIFICIVGAPAGPKQKSLLC